MNDQQIPRLCPKCGLPGMHPTGGSRSSLYCVKHYRFYQMRHDARASRKTVPTAEELSGLLPVDMTCVGCKRVMNWFERDGAGTVITLQHDDDGTHRLICKACNTRHRSMGDAMYEMPTGHRWCGRCKKAKPIKEFGVSSELWKGLHHRCRLCHNTYQRERYHVNKARANNVS